MCITNIGSNSFRPKEYPNEQDFINNIVIPAYKAANREFPDIKVKWAAFPNYNVPSSFFESSSEFSDVSDKLFMNAWDCWSVPGNGNALDPTLDGYWGRSSAISLLCSPLCNSNMNIIRI